MNNRSRTFLLAQWEICPEVRLSELSAGLCAGWWTFLLLAPVDLFATNKSFLGLSAYGNEPSWAAYTGSVALLEALTLVIGSPAFRLVAIMASTFVWEFLAVHIALSSAKWHGMPVNTGFGAYSIYSIISALAAYKLMRFAVPDISQSLERTIKRSQASRLYRLYCRCLDKRKARNKRLP